MAGSFTAKASLTGEIRVALGTAEVPDCHGSFVFYWEHGLLQMGAALARLLHAEAQLERTQRA